MLTSSVVAVAVKTFSISMDERAYRQAKTEADRAGVSMSAWMARAAREKIQRAAAVHVAETDRRTGDAWAQWTETSESDLDPPEAGRGAA